MKQRWTRRCITARSGSAAIEYGLLLPALLIFMFGVIDLGRVMWTQTTLDRAVAAAARCGAINTTTCGSTAQIQANAVAEAFGLAVTVANFAVTTPACGVQVAATFSFTFIIPWMTTPTISLQAMSCYPL